MFAAEKPECDPPMMTTLGDLFDLNISSPAKNLSLFKKSSPRIIFSLSTPSFMGTMGGIEGTPPFAMMIAFALKVTFISHL